MKKLLCVLLISFAAVCVVFGEASAVAEPEVAAANDTSTVTVGTSDESTSPEKSTEPITFDAEKINKAPEQKLLWPIILNIIPEFGIGSFVQHDKLGGWVGVGLSTAVVGCAVVGCVYMVVGALAASAGGIAGALVSGGNSSTANETANEAGDQFFSIGTCLFICAAAFEAINVTWGVVRQFYSATYIIRKM